jgi:hypothetical protein
MAKKGQEAADLHVFLGEINAESAAGTDRGLILLCCSFIDLLLRDLIKARLAAHPATGKLLGDSGEGGLSRFSAKIDIAIALGIIEPAEHSVLHILRDLRNDCAHRISIDLEAQATQSRILDITLKLGFKADVLEGFSSKMKLRNLCIMIIGRLLRRLEDKSLTQIETYSINNFELENLRAMSGA